MFLRIFRSHQNVQLLAMLLTAIILWGDAFFRLLPANPGTGLAPLYGLMFSWSFEWPLLTTIIAFVLLLGSAVLLNQILCDEGLAARNSYLAAFFYLVFFSYHPDLLRLSPVIPANLITILALRTILKSRHKDNPLQDIFSGALFLTLAAFVNIWNLAFIPLIWISLILYRSYSWREWIVSFTGISTPLIYYAAVCFFYDIIPQTLTPYSNFFRSLHFFAADYRQTTFVWVVTAVLALFTAVALLRTLARFSEKVIHLRKATMIVVWLFVLSWPYLPLVRENLILQSAPTLLPASILVTMWVQSAKKTRFIELLLWLLAAAIVVLKVMG